MRVDIDDGKKGFQMMLHRSGLCPSLSPTRVRFPLLAKRFARDLRRFSKLQTFEIPEGMGSQ